MKINVQNKCPHCGSSTGEVYLVGDNKNLFVIKCFKCKYTPVPISCAGITPTQAISYWEEYADIERWRRYRDLVIERFGEKS